MKKYVVTVYEVHSVDIEVEAYNKEEARDLANEKIEQFPYTVEYDHTMDVEDWPVLELGEDE
jgi:capsular polysaccharide biosynthesis protein